MKIVNDVLRLYYGVRCVVSHGVAMKTVDEGCLSKFPPLDELKAGLSDPTVAEELWDLHNRACANRWQECKDLILGTLYDVSVLFSIGKPPHGSRCHGCS